MRLEGKVAIVVGAGQRPGLTMGNGRATSVVFAREGARVLAIDRDLDSAAETVNIIKKEGGEGVAFAADVTDDTSLQAAVAACRDRWGRIDVLHNNVGVSIAAGDAPITEITVEAFDRIVAINLRGMVMACKYALPVMREQRSGVIINISSTAAWSNRYPNVAYKTTKAAVIALTQQIAIQNAMYGIRANVILPGIMDTPMAIDTRVEPTGKSREALVAERKAKIPLGHLGSAWDVAHAALFLASDEAGYITGIALPVDGGMTANAIG